MLIGTYLEQIYAVERTLAPSSLDQLRISVRVFEFWAQNSAIQLTDLSENLLSSFLAHHSRTRAPKTVHRRRGDLLAIWNHAADGDFCRYPNSRRVRRIRLSKRLPDAFTLDQLRLMLSGANLAEGYYHQTALTRAGFWRGWIIVQYNTALRTGDMLRVPYREAMRGQFSLVQAKTGIEQIYALSEEALRILDEIASPERDWLFPWPYCRRTFHDDWKAYVLGAAGILPSRRTGPQKMRRTAASWLERVCPGSGARLLGHLTPGLAAKHYIDPRIANGRPPLPPAVNLDK